MVAGGRLSDLDEGGRAAARISAAGVVQCPALCDPLWHRVAGDAEGIKLEVVKLPEAKRGFVLLPRRWVVERSFAWPRAAAGSSRIMSATRQLLPVSTSSLSSDTCSNKP